MLRCLRISDIFCWSKAALRATSDGTPIPTYSAIVVLNCVVLYSLSSFNQSCYWCEYHATFMCRSRSNGVNGVLQHAIPCRHHRLRGILDEELTMCYYVDKPAWLFPDILVSTWWYSWCESPQPGIILIYDTAVLYQVWCALCLANKCPVYCFVCSLLRSVRKWLNICWRFWWKQCGCFAVFIVSILEAGSAKIIKAFSRGVDCNAPESLWLSRRALLIRDLM